MTVTKPVIGFVGTGMMGQLAHLANYARLRDAGECEIAGVTDLKRQLAEAVATKYGVSKVYASTEDLLADPHIDAVGDPSIGYRTDFSLWQIERSEKVIEGSAHLFAGHTLRMEEWSAAPFG